MIFLKKKLDAKKAIWQYGGIIKEGASFQGSLTYNPAPLSAHNRKAIKMKSKIINTNAKISDGSTVTVSSTVSVPTTLDELEALIGEALDSTEVTAIESHLVDLFVGWCIAHTYQSQVRSKLKTASPSLTYDQLSDLISEIPFRIPRSASAPRGDKIVLKKSQLTAEQKEKLKELGIL